MNLYDIITYESIQVDMLPQLVPQVVARRQCTLPGAAIRWLRSPEIGSRVAIAECSRTLRVLARG